MKKILLLCCTLFAATICLAAKEVKITVIPSDAKIYIDGNYAADGITTATLKTIVREIFQALSGPGSK